MPSWVDGLPAATLPLADRGLAYGDGLFETIAVRGGKPVLLQRHLRRLADGCARLRIELNESLLLAELTAFCAELGEGVAKLIVTRGDGLRGYAPSAGPARRILQGSAMPAYPAANGQQGVQLFACTTRLAEQPLTAGLKHLNRLEQVLARAEWQDARFAEGLMRDTSGRVIEGVFSNILLCRDGVLLTPDLSRCGVAGVMRAELLAWAEAQGIPCKVSDIGLDDLLGADEVMLCNSLYGVWPVREYAGHRWSIGPLTRKLQAVARQLLDC